jgi:gamma-glutamyltranspeptidase/glutathione hydrolase
MRLVHPTRPELRGTFGMVTSTHWLATAAGMAMLEAGGNAFDAAATVGFVLQVVEPEMNGPAGEVPILLWSEADEQVHVVCGQGVAPQAATLEHFAGLGLDTIPGTGLLPATVPGAFGAWLLLLERWGTKPLRDVLAPAIAYAADGFPVTPMLSGALAWVADVFRDDWPTSAATWLPDGRAPTAGARHRLPAQAATYERILREAEAASSTRDGQLRAAADAWYRGFVAEAVDAFARTAWPDTTDEPHAGLLTADDLARWQATVEPSTSFTYRGCTLHKTGPWGQGPVALAQLAVLDALDLSSVATGSAEHVHLVTEAAKLAFADREAWLGDSSPIDDVVAALTDPAYAATRAALIEPTASGELRPGAIAGHAPVLPTVGQGDGATAGEGEPSRQVAAQMKGDTCHLDVVDRWGNLVSATPSGGWCLSSPTVPDLGFCLGTRGQMFWLEPGLASSLRPGTRPRTTLSPNLAFRDGEPWLAFGTPGGDQQDQWSLEFFLAHAAFGLDLQAAIDAPMFHTTHFRSSFYPRAAEPRRVELERRVPAATIEALRARGHDVLVGEDWEHGRVSAVSRAPDGLLRGAANPRGMQGYAVGR